MKNRNWLVAAGLSGVILIAVLWQAVQPDRDLEEIKSDLQTAVSRLKESEKLISTQQKLIQNLKTENTGLAGKLSGIDSVNRMLELKIRESLDAARSGIRQAGQVADSIRIPEVPE